MITPKRVILKGPYLEKSGYLFVDIFEPDNDRKYSMPYHRYVVEEGTGEKIKRGYVVHHRDGHKANNLFSNLQVMTKTAHKKLHRTLKAQKKIVKLNKRIAKRHALRGRIR